MWKRESGMAIAFFLVELSSLLFCLVFWVLGVKFD